MLAVAWSSSHNSMEFLSNSGLLGQNSKPIFENIWSTRVFFIVFARDSLLLRYISTFFLTCCEHRRLKELGKLHQWLLSGPLSCFMFQIFRRFYQIKYWLDFVMFFSFFKFFLIFFFTGSDVISFAVSVPFFIFVFPALGLRFQIQCFILKHYKGH